MLRVDNDGIQVKTKNQHEFWLLAQCGYYPQAILVPGPLSLLGIYMNLPHALAEYKHTRLLLPFTVDYVIQSDLWYLFTCLSYVFRTKG